MKVISSFCLLMISVFSLFAQNTSLYLPRDLQRAYENHTRSYDGKPGAAYWQNKSDYHIKVQLEPKTGAVTGQETIRYSNNSPDTLRQIVIRLYQNFFRKGGARDWAISPNDVHDGVQIAKLMVDDSCFVVKKENNKLEMNQTNLVIHLSKAILPRSVSNLQIDWSFVIAKNSHVRMGRYDSTSFFVGHWYPQIAVYDDIDGWDEYQYTGTQEFYNDFSNFDVEVTVPSDFIVWATGELQNAQEIFTKKFLKKLNKAQKSDEITRLISVHDSLKNEILLPAEKRIWKFNAQSVPDFAFATSNHYLWDVTSLIVDQKTKRRVAINAAYKKQSQDFYEVAEIARKTLDYLSNEMPGVPFPYPSMTVFNGGGGMEYPMMVNDASTARRSDTVHLTSHEITHTYFPFFMGTNERKYAWMDEGWAQMLPIALQYRLESSVDPLIELVDDYCKFAGTELETPPIVPSVVYGSNVYRPSYRNASYNRSGMAYQLLKDLLGEELFRKALHEFIARWNGKHPIPYDFFFTFNNAADEDLSWFWKPWFFDWGYPDLAIREAIADGGNTHLIVENPGRFPLPIKAIMYYEDGDSLIVQKNLSVWQSNQPGISLEIQSLKPIKKIKLGDKHIPDVNLKNNVLELSSDK